MSRDNGHTGEWIVFLIAVFLIVLGLGELFVRGVMSP